MKYCQKCGKELLDEAVICPGCGCATGYAMPRVYNPGMYVSELVRRLRVEGVAWIVIAVIQLVVGIFVLPREQMATKVSLVVVGILNLSSSISELAYAHRILHKNRTGITDRFESLARPIINLLYNLIFGGVIGVVGSLYYLFAVRKYVIDNSDIFDEAQTAFLHSKAKK